MKEITFIVEEDLEGGFTARALGEAIFTEGDTMEELRVNLREAVDAHFDDGQAPQSIRLQIVREELLENA